jgi:hypothetical protein
VKKSPKIDAALKKIENDIAALQSTLPPRLQLETEHESRTDLRRIALWLRRQHRNDGGLRLNGLTGGQYPTERDPHTLQVGEILRLETTNDGVMNFRDQAGAAMSRLINRTATSYPDCVAAMRLCYGSAALRAEFLRIEREFLPKATGTSISV